jgi:hypothetical protein
LLEGKGIQPGEEVKQIHDSPKEGLEPQMERAAELTQAF